jgi:hypothetical protein
MLSSSQYVLVFFSYSLLETQNIEEKFLFDIHCVDYTLQCSQGLLPIFEELIQTNTIVFQFFLIM